MTHGQHTAAEPANGCSSAEFGVCLVEIKGIKGG